MLLSLFSVGHHRSGFLTWACLCEPFPSQNIVLFCLCLSFNTELTLPKQLFSQHIIIQHATELYRICLMLS